MRCLAHNTDMLYRCKPAHASAETPLPHVNHDLSHIIKPLVLVLPGYDSVDPLEENNTID